MKATVLPKRTLSWSCPFCCTVQVIHAAKTVPQKHMKPLHCISSEPTHTFNRSNRTTLFLMRLLTRSSSAGSYSSSVPFTLPKFLSQPPISHIYPPGLQARCTAPDLKALRHWMSDQLVGMTAQLTTASCKLSCWIPSLCDASNLWLFLPWGH